VSVHCIEVVQYSVQEYVQLSRIALNRPYDHLSAANILINPLKKKQSAFRRVRKIAVSDY
jgi:hypothetical protein